MYSAMVARFETTVAALMVRLHWEDAVSCNAWYTLSSEKFRRRAVLLAKALGRLAWLSDMLKELGPKCHDQLAMPITLQVLVRLNATLYRLYLRDSSCRLPKFHCLADNTPLYVGGRGSQFLDNVRRYVQPCTCKQRYHDECMHFGNGAKWAGTCFVSP